MRESVRLSLELARAALRDPLTGLRSRRSLAEPVAARSLVDGSLDRAEDEGLIQVRVQAGTEPPSPAA